jgi:DNA-binding NarL/FixJ family response regulator
VPKIRILVADDFEPWRHYVCSMLEAIPGYCVVAQVGDGLEAVQKAQELKPDLILLDIALPRLDGLKAANRILEAAPKARIIFLTTNGDIEIKRAALRCGARDYVLKADAAKELMPAIHTALSDRTGRCGVE